VDPDLQLLAQRWLETGDPTHEQRYLQALREVGTLRRRSVEVAAWLGDEVARRLLAHRGPLFRPPPTLRSYLELLPGDGEVKGRASLAVLELVAQRERAAEHELGQRVLRALDSEDPPTVERLLTARAGARRTTDALWRDMVQLGHDLLSDADAEPLAAALRQRLLPWVLVRPDPGGPLLEGLGRAPTIFAPDSMTPEAARAVLTVPAAYPYDSAEGKELIGDYLLALGWKRGIGGVTAPGGQHRVKFDMTERRLALETKRGDGWVETWPLPLFLGEVAGRLVLQAEDALRAAAEPHPETRQGRVRRRRKGETRQAAWIGGGPPTLAQLDQIAELQRGMRDAEFQRLLREVAGVESMADLRREPAGKLILALSGF